MVNKQEVSRLENSLVTNPDVKKFYGYVNKRLNSSHSHNVILKDGKPIGDYEKSVLFNGQFSSVFTIDDGRHINMRHKRVETILSNINFEPVALAKAFGRLKNKSSCGVDGIPSLFYKFCKESLLRPISMICCRSFETSNLPETG